jgi:cytochrome P450
MSGRTIAYPAGPDLAGVARLVDPEFYAGDPHPVYARLRAEAPVYWCEEGEFWALTRYDDVRQVGHDNTLFTSGRGTLIAEGRERATSQTHGPHIPGAHHLIRTGPPDHAPMRKIVARSFTPRSVSALGERARSIARELIDQIDGDAVTDVVQALSAPLTTYVIAELMGVPRERWAEFWDWTDSAILQIDAGRDDPAHAAKIADLMEFFRQLCAERKQNPGDDIVTDLVTGEFKGEPLNEVDLLTYCKFLLVAGTETTRNLISHGVALLAQHPEQRRLLVDEPDRTPLAIEEMLRISSPVFAFCRTATADTEIRGQQIAAGDYVAMYYASANRDEQIWSDPDRFDITRPVTRPHVAFGFGPHVCLGAGLARMESKVLFEELLRAYPDYELAGAAVPGPSTLISIVTAQPVVFGARSRTPVPA